MIWFALIGAAASLGGAVMSSNAAARNAAATKNLAADNARRMLEYGHDQANVSMLSAAYNSILLKRQAEVKSEAAKAIAGYNSEILRQTANYNSLLYDKEIDSVFKAAELDTNVLEVAVAKARGAVEAHQSVSNVIMGQDSNADVVIDMKAQEALEKLVISTNAQTKATELLNASAKGQWQAETEARKITYEAEVSGEAAMLTASMQSTAALFEGHMNSWSAITNSENRAYEALQDAELKSSRYNDESKYHLYSGISSAAGSLASGWSASGRVSANTGAASAAAASGSLLK